MTDEGNDDTFLPMDSGPARPELVDEPRIQDVPDTDGPARGPDGKFIAKEDTGDSQQETADPVTPTENPIPEEQFKGYLTEKRKRQELEDQVAALQRQIQTFQQQPPQPTDFWEDPNAVIGQQVSQAVRQAMAEVQQQQEVQRLNASEVAAKAKYADYDDAFHSFRQAVSLNPALAARMQASPDPAEYAYKTGKAAMDLERVGSIDDLLKAERAKWEAEARAAIPAPRFPASTATDGSVQSRGGPIWSGPTADKDILPMG